jgi:hypothetical protein
LYGFLVTFVKTKNFAVKLTSMVYIDDDMKLHVFIDMTSGCYTLQVCVVCRVNVCTDPVCKGWEGGLEPCSVSYPLRMAIG